MPVITQEELMKKPTDPYIETFRLQAERMDELDIPCNPNAAMVLLAQFMVEIESRLSQEDMFALAEIGAHMYREGRGRDKTRRVE